MQTISRRLLGKVSALGVLGAMLPAEAFAAEAIQPGASLPGNNPPPIDPMSLVNSELRDFLIKNHQPAGSPSAPVPSINAFRPIKQTPNPTFSPTPHVEEVMVPGSPGQPAVRVFVIGGDAPRNSTRRPAILHIHGGGFIASRAADAVPALQRLSAAHDCVIVTVDYRLAPETPFPGALEDNYAALTWLNQNAQRLNVDADRIIVAGESAGGGHAAMLAIAVRDRGMFRLKAQILTYPMLDDRTGSVHPVPPFIGAFMWHPQSNQLGWSSLLGVPAGSKAVPPGSVPARVSDLRGLPPTFIGVGSIDLFAQEDLDYAQRLLMSGIPTELYLAPGAYHGFDIFVPNASVSKNFLMAFNGAISRAFS